MKTNHQLLSEAFKDLMLRVPDAHCNDVNSVSVRVYTNKETGKHAHASASVRVHFSGYAEEKPKATETAPVVHNDNNTSVFGKLPVPQKISKY